MFSLMTLLVILLVVLASFLIEQYLQRKSHSRHR